MRLICGDVSLKHLTSNAIYGYKKDPEDNNHRLVDEEAAAVVRRIFQLIIEGKNRYHLHPSG